MRESVIELYYIAGLFLHCHCSILYYMKFSYVHLTEREKAIGRIFGRN